MLVQLGMAFVVIGPHRGFLGAVHAFDLAVGPRVVGLGQTMIDGHLFGLITPQHRDAKFKLVARTPSELTHAIGTKVYRRDSLENQFYIADFELAH